MNAKQQVYPRLSKLSYSPPKSLISNRNINKMRIKRKPKSRIHRSDVQSENEDFNDSADFSATRPSKSVYHHGKNSNFSKTIFELNCKSKPQITKPLNRRNKTLTERKNLF